MDYVEAALNHAREVIADEPEPNHDWKVSYYPQNPKHKKQRWYATRDEAVAYITKSDGVFYIENIVTGEWTKQHRPGETLEWRSASREAPEQ